MYPLYTPGKYPKGATVRDAAGLLWLCVKEVNAKASPKAGAYWKLAIEGLIPWPVHKCYADTNSPPSNFAGYFDGNPSDDAFPPSQEVMHEISYQYFVPYDEQNVALSRIRLFDDNGTAEANGQIPFEVQVQPLGSFDWVTVDRFSGSLWKQWQDVLVPQEVRAQRFRFKFYGTKGPSGGFTSLKPTQIEVYGRHTPYTRPAFNPLGRSLTAQFPVNAYRYTWQAELLNPLGGGRLYYNTNYIRIEGEDGWRFEEVIPLLRQNREAGNFTLPCLLECPVEIARTYPTYRDNDDGTPGNTNFVAAPYGVDRETPEAWRYGGRTCFQFAAMAGRNSDVDRRLIKQMPTALHPDWGQADPEIVVGADLVDIFGTANEPDQTWHGVDGYHRVREQAMQLSVQWDGHKGYLGEGVGMKAADPTMKQALGGLYQHDYGRLQGLHDAWAETRGYLPNGYVDCPVHLFDFHGYNSRGRYLANGFTPDPTDPPRGEVPYANREGYRQFVRVVHELFGPDVLVGRTEYGYSLGANSVQRVEPIGEYTREQVQGQWLAQDGIENMVDGLDISCPYQLGDDPYAATHPDHPDSDKKCGIAGRPAWSYLAQLVANADGYVNAGIVLNPERDPTKATAVKLVKPGASDKYLVWMGNRTGQSAPFKLPLSGKTAVVRHQLQDTGTQTRDTLLSIKGSLSGTATGLVTIYTAT